MKKTFRSTMGTLLSISLLFSMFMGINVFGVSEKSLVKDTGDFAMSYGSAIKIANEQKDVIDLIKKSGKTDFEEGFYATFGGGFGGTSEQYLHVDTKGYNKLVFDVCAVTEGKFGNLQAYINWSTYRDFAVEYGETYLDLDTFKKDFSAHPGTDSAFRVEVIKEGEFPSMSGPNDFNIYICDGDWNTRYSVTASNDWNTVELDISGMNEMIFSIATSGPSDMLIANPRLVKTGSESVPTLQATTTSSKVLVNGDVKSFDAYTINDNNYFKLRDLAFVVSGTEKQFEVKWDSDLKAINLLTKKPYTEVGGEMAKGDGRVRSPIANTSKIYIDGQEIALTAYTINNNNYFKLRDIAQAFDIGITWDSATKTIGIDTRIGYAAP